MNELAEMGSDFLRDLGDAARNNPVSAALIGMGVLWMLTGARGAGIAAAVPATDLEAEYFGKASDQLKERAVDMASEQAERVAVAAEDVIVNVSEEARKQGLTVDAAKAAVADIPAKVGRVVE